MGVFDQLKSGSSSSSSGGVFGQLKKVDDYHNARGVAEADEQWQVAHQWDNSLSTPISDIRKSTLMQQVQAAQSAPLEQPQDNSREIPIIGPVLKGLDWFAKTPVQHFIADVGQWAYTPGAGLANIAGLTGAAESAVARALPKLGNSLGGRVAQKGISEVIANAPLGAGQTLATNPDASMQDVLTGAAIGGAAGGVLGAAGKGVFAGLAKFGDNAATKLTGNAIQNVAENTRSRVISPFADEAAAFNPVAKGYTENVARTFEPKASQGIPKSEPIFTPSQYKVGESAIPTTADGAHLSEPKLIEDVQSKDGVNYYKFEGSNTYMPENMVAKGGIPRGNVANPSVQQPIKTSSKNPDELKFAQTVKESSNTPPDLLAAMNKEPMTGARTTDILNHKQASELIKQHGAEGLYAKLMAKKFNFSPAETVSALLAVKITYLNPLTLSLRQPMVVERWGRRFKRLVSIIS
jgi:hypothetical protein